MYEKLPADIKDRYVLLMDPVLGTGNTACKALQVGAPSCSWTLKPYPPPHTHAAQVIVSKGVDPEKP